MNKDIRMEKTKAAADMIAEYIANAQLSPGNRDFKIHCALTSLYNHAYEKGRLDFEMETMGAEGA